LLFGLINILIKNSNFFYRFSQLLAF